MNRYRFFSKWLVWMVCIAAAVCFSSSVARSAPPRKIELKLVWGTNDEKSPDEKHKKLDPELVKKLRMFKWKSYFLVNSEVVSAKPNTPTKKRLSDECEVQLKDLGNSMLEVELWGKGKLIRRIKEKVTVEDSVAIAGDAANDSAWLILIKEVP